MATVLPTSTWNRAATDQKVRHPLQTVRGYLRTYVLLEGLAYAVLFMACAFWLGVLFDYGLFAVFSFDWIKSMDQSFPPLVAWSVRASILGAVVLGLLLVLVLKLARRYFVEFSDTAVALLLEKRFPAELGDRLITAVELADPQMSQQYGYSQAMVDETIQAAAERVAKLPVQQAFNWRRLWLMIIGAGAATLGVYLLVYATFTILALTLAENRGADDVFLEQLRVSAVWTERNALLYERNYWPTRSYLEIARFQAAAENADEMRVGRDEQRPDIQARAFEWVVADRTVAEGMRPLLVTDLQQYLPEQYAQLTLPSDWRGWSIDLDDLDRPLPSALVLDDWQGKSSGQLRDRLKDSATRRLLEQTKVLPSLEKVLDWRTWTVDQLKLQLEKSEVQKGLAKSHASDYNLLKQMLGTDLPRLATEHATSWQIRRLLVPATVYFRYSGATKSKNDPYEPRSNRYYISLVDLKESGTFTVRGEDFTTRPKQITLVPPPSITKLDMVKEVPAYLYYRLDGADQSGLAGQRQRFPVESVSINGEVSNILVPFGSRLELTATVDRPLRGAPLVLPPPKRTVEGSITPNVPSDMLKPSADGLSFGMSFASVTQAMQLELHYHDTDGVLGKRMLIIEPIHDKAPSEVLPVDLNVVLRKPRFREQSKSLLALQEAYLITPDALLPFKGTFRDDHGLTKLEWKYELEEVKFELAGPDVLVSGGQPKAPSLAQEDLAQILRICALASSFTATATQPLHYLVLEQGLELEKLERSRFGDIKAQKSLLMNHFARRLNEGRTISLPKLIENLKKPAFASMYFKEHSLQQEELDLRRELSDYKSQNQAKQQHYRLKLLVVATDSNIETGPGVTLSKQPFAFLVVSEGELLGQILIEETTLAERLTATVDKLKTTRVILDDQLKKLGTIPPRELSLVSIRLDDVRKNVQDASGVAREVLTDYSRIWSEMKVNRLAASQIARVEGKILEPLEEVLHPQKGEFPVTEALVLGTWEKIETDVSIYKKADEAKALTDKLLADLKANHVQHLAEATKVRGSLEELIRKLEGVLNSLQGELDFEKEIAKGLQIQRDQAENASRFHVWYQRMYEEVFRDLIAPPMPPMPKN